MSAHESKQDTRQDFTPVLLDALLTLKKRELANRAPFKARAYGTVLQQLQQLQQEGSPIHSMDDLAGIKGLGEKIREKVQEIFATGQLQTAEKAKEVYDLKAHDELQHIYGIGPAKATDLIQQGIRSVQLLREAVLANPAILNDKQRIGLQYYEDLLERIPREEMMRHEQLLVQASPFPAELVGSYRRVSPDSGDIDVLIRIPPGKTTKDAKSQFYQYVQHLKDIGYLEQILALGEHKCMGICRMGSGKGRRLDLLLTPDDEYACSLLYFTGSDKFNVAFRQHALQRGYTLNEHRLTALGSSSDIPFFQQESDIFHFLGLQYTPPHERMDSIHPLPPRMKVRRPILASPS